jgi:catechol 2,3-dioxygenase-like lactoylglutathione lyase family enzyme
MIRRIWDITLTIKDLKKAIEFYENVLGLQKKYEFDDYAGFDCGGVELGVKTWGELQPPRKGEPCIDFLVDNVDEVYRTLRGKGVKFLEKPKDTLWGAYAATFTDPDGNVLQLVQIHWGKYFKICAPK